LDTITGQLIGVLSDLCGFDHPFGDAGFLPQYFIQKYEVKI